MSTRDLTKLACQILGIYFLINGIATIPSVVSYFVAVQSFKGGDALTSSIGMSFLLGSTLSISNLVTFTIAGLFLLFRADSIAKRLCRNVDWQEVQSHWTVEEIQAISFSIIGLYILITVIPDATRFTIHIISKVIDYKDISPSVRGESIVNSEAWANIAWLTSKTVVGLWLIFGAQGLSQFIIRFRNGISKKDAPNPK